MLFCSYKMGYVFCVIHIISCCQLPPGRFVVNINDLLYCRRDVLEFSDSGFAIELLRYRCFLATGPNEYT